MNVTDKIQQRRPLIDNIRDVPNNAATLASYRRKRLKHNAICKRNMLGSLN